MCSQFLHLRLSEFGLQGNHLLDILGLYQAIGKREGIGDVALAAYPVDSGLSRCSMLSNRIGAVARVGTDGEGAVACRIQEVVFR